MIRQPAVAGQFYPGNARSVEAGLDQFIHPVAVPRPAIGLVVPHAGWMYSGATAGIAYSSVKIPDHVIMIGPNHHGLGSPYALFDAGKWLTPGGKWRWTSRWRRNCWIIAICYRKTFVRTRWNIVWRCRFRCCIA